MLHQTIPLYEGNQPFVYVCYCAEDDALAFPILARMYNEGFRIWCARAGGVPSDFRTIQRMNYSACIILFMSQAMLERIRLGDSEISAVIKNSRLRIVINLDSTNPGNEMYALSVPERIPYSKGNDAPFWLQIYSADYLEQCRGPWPDKKLLLRDPEFDDVREEVVNAEYQSLENIMKTGFSSGAAPVDDHRYIPSQPDEYVYAPLDLLDIVKTEEERAFEDFLGFLDECVSENEKAALMPYNTYPVTPSAESIVTVPDRAAALEAKEKLVKELLERRKQSADQKGELSTILDPNDIDIRNHPENYPEPSWQAEEQVSAADSTADEDEPEMAAEPETSADSSVIAEESTPTEDEKAEEIPSDTAQTEALEVSEMPSQSTPDSIDDLLTPELISSAQDAPTYIMLPPANGAATDAPSCLKLIDAGGSMVAVPADIPGYLRAGGVHVTLPDDKSRKNTEAAATETTVSDTDTAAAETPTVSDDAPESVTSADIQNPVDEIPLGSDTVVAENSDSTQTSENTSEQTASTADESTPSVNSYCERPVVPIVVKKQATATRVVPIRRQPVVPIVRPKQTTAVKSVPDSIRHTSSYIPPIHMERGELKPGERISFEQYIRKIALSALSAEQKSEEQPATMRKYRGKPAPLTPIEQAAAAGSSSSDATAVDSEPMRISVPAGDAEEGTSAIADDTMLRQSYRKNRHPHNSRLLSGLMAALRRQRSSESLDAPAEENVDDLFVIGSGEGRTYTLTDDAIDRDNITEYTSEHSDDVFDDSADRFSSPLLFAAIEKFVESDSNTTESAPRRKRA